jgi:hypothetical protein
MPTALKLSKTPSTHGHRYSPKSKIKKAHEFLMVHLYLLDRWTVPYSSIK